MPRKKKSTALQTTNAATTAAAPVVSLRNMTQAEAISSFNEHEMHTYQSLYQIISKKQTNDLWWYWQLGQRLAKLQEELKAHSNYYGSNFMERLAIALLGSKTSGTMKAIMRVATAFPSKEDFEGVLKLRGPCGEQLTWTHISYLASVDDDDARGEYATKALTSGWNAKQLLAAIQSNTARPSHGGRPTKAPRSAAECLQNMQSVLGKLINQYDTAWTGSRFNLNQALSELDTNDIDDKLLDALEAAQQQFAEVRARAEEAQAALAAAIVSFKQRLANKKGATDNVEEDYDYEDDEEEEADYDDDEYVDGDEDED